MRRRDFVELLALAIDRRHDLGDEKAGVGGEGCQQHVVIPAKGLEHPRLDIDADTDGGPGEDEKGYCKAQQYAVSVVHVGMSLSGC